MCADALKILTAQWGGKDIKDKIYSLGKMLITLIVEQNIFDFMVKYH